MIESATRDRQVDNDADEVEFRKWRPPRQPRSANKRTDKIEVDITQHRPPVTITCPCWLVRLAGGGLPAIIACQALYWFSRQKVCPPDWPERRTWFTSFPHLAEQLHLPTTRAGHKSLMRAFAKLKMLKLLKLRPCPPLSPNWHGGRYQPLLFDLLARVDPRRRIAIIEGSAMLAPDPRIAACIARAAAGLPEPEWRGPGLNAVHPVAIATFGSNEAIVLARLVWLFTQNSKPVVAQYHSLARTTGLTVKQVRGAIRSLRSAGAIKRAFQCRGIVATGMYAVNPEVLEQFPAPGT